MTATLIRFPQRPRIQFAEFEDELIGPYYLAPVDGKICATDTRTGRTWLNFENWKEARQLTRLKCSGTVLEP